MFLKANCFQGRNEIMNNIILLVMDLSPRLALLLYTTLAVLRNWLCEILDIFGLPQIVYYVETT